MAEPIEIIIRQGGSSGGLGFGSATGGAVGGSYESSTRGQGFLGSGIDMGEKTAKQFGAIDAMLVNAMKSQIKSTIMFGLQNYGNMTGDYIGQRNINNAIGLIGDVTMIGVSTAKYGWAGFVVSSISTAMNKGMQYSQYMIEISKQNIQAEQMRIRAGNALNSGSRGTYE